MRKHRVRLRPKLRTRRRGTLRSVAAGLLAAAGLWAAARAKPWRTLEPAGGWLRWPSAARVETVSFKGVPASLESALAGALGWRPGDAWGPLRHGRAAGDLRERFPCLRGLEARRDWSGRSVVFVGEARAPVARVGSKGAAKEFLDAAGVVFPAPPGLYPEGGLPAVEGPLPAGEPPQALGRFVEESVRNGSLPAGLKALRYAGVEDGWDLELVDGTALRWGKLDWTAQKLERLREVLADARTRLKDPLAADLRQFEEGRIFVRTR